ncbi:flagellar biosynthesis regulator FlaF [Desulfosarcina sp. OttesenSCG-928-G10]|nr:flagellar biosynthesis regulator FlaF [Desulfosarcina sp. OttesenSCG-928-G10]
MFNKAINAYQNIEQATLTGRDAEARVLTKAAQKLKACQQHWDAPNLKEMLHEALDYNQRVWAIFQAELGNPENPLPPAIRRDILLLSAYADKRTLEILGSSRPEPDQLDIIIRINENIAAGLREKVASTEEPSLF